MAKNKKKISTPSEKALCELEKEFLHREKMYESALTFLNNSDTIKGFISQETFEKTFKKVPGIKEEQQKFVEEVRIRLEKIFVDCLETAESDEEHFSLIEDLVSLSNEIENNRVLQVNSIASRKRFVVEFKRRYAAVPAHFWQTCQNLSEAGQRAGLFYAILKTYKLVFDFHFNVTMKKWNSPINFQ